MQTAHRRQLANAIRALAMDAVQKANSGHPGMPMGMADIAEVLWNDHLKHNPGNPLWPDRDRFVVSNGHGSMLLYSLLHLTGYPLKLEDLQKFRQLGSHTAGHPEHDSHLGIETTTGPLGQGLANAVGMALAEKHLAAAFNRPGHEIVDHRTWVFLGDGCLMEGVSHEACSLAGTLKLGKLIAFYDDNGISIDGEVHGWFTDDTPKRFEAYGWHVVANVDGHDPAAIEKAIAAAVAQTDKPSLICCKTIIGWGSPNKQGTEATHGAALGADEVAATRKHLGWNYEPFVIPDEIRSGWDARDKGAQRESEWQKRFDAYQAEFPELAAEYQRRQAGELPSGWRDVVSKYVAEVAKESKALATRQSSQASLNAYGPGLPELLGGSADLTGSNNTNRKDSRSMTGADPSGNYIHYGVREFGMSALMNGMALHGGLIPYGGTFLVFSDYARNAMRMSALMKQRVIYVMTHDSIGLGEDGPTHQPVEHLPSLRIIPNMIVWRPCDSTETALAWADAIERRDGPTTLALTRQALPQQPRSEQQIANIRRGGYVLKDSDGAPEAILIATGSEVAVAVEAAAQLQQAGKRVRVVSMPSTNVFEAQDESYREQVLPRNVEVRVAIEAAATETWYRYVGPRGAIIGMTTFGASGVAKDLFKHFGFTADNVVRTVQKLLQ
ncbi:transketolase [Steroidobacter sp. S1-65]|uniref:Transketolase n=1 Tax=Steroidobacter gossypii TaxID=2805490 RepID=A0ABS1X3Y6_9GAMM|nr:transketolase [Steroidobacter gossypii]MBM0107936.1 transketolase [Steroidobacter gossypii]